MVPIQTLALTFSRPGNSRGLLRRAAVKRLSRRPRRGSLRRNATAEAVPVDSDAHCVPRTDKEGREHDAPRARERPNRDDRGATADQHRLENLRLLSEGRGHWVPNDTHSARHRSDPVPGPGPIQARVPFRTVCARTRLPAITAVPRLRGLRVVWGSLSLRQLGQLTGRGGHRSRRTVQMRTARVGNNALLRALTP